MTIWREIMNYHVLTLFPDMIRSIVGTSILGRALKAGTIGLDVINIRDFSQDKNNRVDDYPYGGGAGMVMEAEPVYQAVCKAKENVKGTARVIYMTPQAQVLNQVKAEELAMEDDLIILCGHYEGIDERVLEEVVTDYVSIGDYVLTGGELGACVLIDAVSRFVPGVLSNDESSQFESLQDDLLEYPHFTRPESWHDKKVPDVLLSGDHKKVNEWRYEQSVKRTKQRRPDLYKKSLSVHTLFFGETSEAAELINSSVSRYGELCDYNRNKLKKQKRIFGKHDLAVIVFDSAAGTAEALKCVKAVGTKTILVNASDEDTHELSEKLKTAGFDIKAVTKLSGLQEKDIKRLSIFIRSAV